MVQKVKHILLISFLLLCSKFIMSQDKNDIRDILFKSNEMISTENMDTCSAKESVFIDKYSHLFPNEPEPWPMKMAWETKDFNAFKIFDINGDGKFDIIYSGDMGAEECQNYLWIQNEGRFTFIGFISGYLKFIRNSKNDMCTIVSTCNYGSDGYPIGNLIHYKIDKKGNKYKISILQSIQEHYDTHPPLERTVEKKIVITQNNSPLRFELSDNDTLNTETSEVFSMSMYGNLLAKLNKGNTGVAIAKETDVKGEDWFLILLDSHKKTTYSLFMDNLKGKAMGWIKSKYLKFIN